MTIIEAALFVLKKEQLFMSAHDIYNQIVDNELYVFHAQNPLAVLRSELRSHSEGIDFPTASKKKVFVYDETNGKFGILQKKQDKNHPIIEDKSYIIQVRELYDSYLKDFRTNILTQLRK